MLNKWHQEYENLTEYISHHPEIIISREHISTPEESRAGFYDLFNSVILTLTKDAFPVLVKNAKLMVDSYKKAAAEIASLISIEKTKSYSDFYRFLDNPEGILAKSAFELLFDLLKGKINESSFEQLASQSIESSAHRLGEAVYGKWIILSLVSMLGADEIYSCTPVKVINRRLEYFSQFDTHRPVHTPLPVKTSRFSWEYNKEPMITQPDFILHTNTGGKGKYISIKSDFKMATRIVEDLPKGGEWISVEPTFTLDSDVILIYTSDNLSTLSLISENSKICRPQLIIKHIEDDNRDPSQWLEEARKTNDLLKPVSGFYMVSRIPTGLPHEAVTEDKIRFIEAGLDRTKLMPVINTLLTMENESDTNSTGASATF